MLIFLSIILKNTKELLKSLVISQNKLKILILITIENLLTMYSALLNKVRFWIKIERN